jgi:hypothetical protein
MARPSIRLRPNMRESSCLNEMPNMNNGKPRPTARRSSRRASRTVPEGGHAAYKAYAVGADGSHRLIDARSIIVDLDGAQVEIDLKVARPVLAHQLRVSARGENKLLIVGHGDASSIYLLVQSEIRR